MGQRDPWSGFMGNGDKHLRTLTNTVEHRWTLTNTDKHRQTPKNTDKNRQTQMNTRVSYESTFLIKKIGPTRSASIWGLLWRNPEDFLISTSFRWCTSHFRFDHFYIVDFHSALNLKVSLCQIEGWVKIYNVKMVKTEMTCAPPKTCRN